MTKITSAPKKTVILGFTLIELLIFMVIVSIAMSGIVPLLMEVTNTSFIRESTQARFLVEETLEDLRADVEEKIDNDTPTVTDSFTNIYNISTNTTYPSTTVLNIGAAINFSRNITLTGATYTGNTLTCNPGTIPVDYACVTVTVTNATTGEMLSSGKTTFSKIP
ncbi:MAG: type II secretion system GspH family protein [Magnetococcus sp. DMHC-6]